jgi:hypothetical protein
MRAHEDLCCTRGDESVDEVLCESSIDLPDLLRRPLTVVEARVVDVDVEPVLVRRMPHAPEAAPEIAAARPREVADADTRRLRVGGGVLLENAEQRAHEPWVAPPPPAAVRRPLQRAVPREEPVARRRKLNTADEPALPWQPERLRRARLRACAGREDERRGDEGNCDGMPALHEAYNVRTR